MQDIDNIFLVGMPGSGKTTVGRQLARLRGLDFIDLDHEIERRTGVRVTAIFDIEGEAGFRQREAALVAEVARGRGQVIATGGGAILNTASRELLHDSGVVIYLHVSPRELYERTKSDASRPLLQVADRMKRIEEIYQVRDPLYRACAHQVISNTRGTVRSMVAAINESLKQCAN